VLYIDPNLRHVLSVADRIIVLEHGRVVGEVQSGEGAVRVRGLAVSIASGFSNREIADRQFDQRTGAACLPT
jgi:ABC-type sugar transport system ATPase subunit